MNKLKRKISLSYRYNNWRPSDNDLFIKYRHTYINGYNDMDIIFEIRQELLQLYY